MNKSNIMFQRLCTKEGYITQVYTDLVEGYYRWYSLRNWGEDQGSAIAFQERDCPELDDRELKMLIERYRIENIYTRIGKRNYKRIH